VEKLNLEAKAKGYKVIGMTASSLQLLKVQKNNGLSFDFILRWNYFKTIERANPSIVVLEKGQLNRKCITTTLKLEL
jgi:hypothetical protein